MKYYYELAKEELEREEEEPTEDMILERAVDLQSEECDRVYDSNR